MVDAAGDFAFVGDAYDLRRANDRWWIFFDARTGMHVALLNPRIDCDEDGCYPTHDGVAVLPEFVDARWPPVMLAPTISGEAGDVYEDDVYDALSDTDWSD
jgi:hypothetical protein